MLADIDYSTPNISLQLVYILDSTFKIKLRIKKSFLKSQDEGGASTFFSPCVPRWEDGPAPFTKMSLAHVGVVNC